MDNKNEILIYEDKDGITKVNVTFTDEDIWLTQNQLAEIYKNQGLYCEAIAIYRKLSLLNSEKSIYFAGLIDEIEGKKDRK